MPFRVCLASLLCCSFAARAEAPALEAGPHFVVLGGDPSIDRLPLKSTAVEVNVVGVLADVVVRQRYANEGARAINTQYVFPGSTRAAVQGLLLRVGDRQVRATLREKNEAKREFEAAQSAGKTASLLTQERPNVFTMRLANVMPRDVVEVELHYSELLVPERQQYEFVFPTVVGPRYASAEGTGETWTATPHTRVGQEPPATFSLHARVATATELFELTSPSHTVDVSRLTPTSAELSIRGEERGTRDFVLRYRLAGERIAAGLMLSPVQDGEGFFLLTVEPPARVVPELIPPREFIFVVDVSGSMFGFPLDTARQLVRELAADLRPTDTFNILFFSGGSRTLSPASLTATPEHLKQALEMLTRIQGSGGTELLPALRHAFSLAADPARARSVIVITDGYVDVEREAMELISRNLGESNLFAFGIGSAVNRYLIEGLARAGRGTPFIVTAPNEARAVADKLREYVRAPLLTHVRVAVEGFEVSGLEPESMPDLLADRPLVVQGKWSGAPRGTIVVSGMTGAGPWHRTFDVSRAVPDDSNSALRSLWARQRISRLSDFAAFGPETNEERELVTALGLRYGLLTRHTSFVAVLEQVRNTSGRADEVEQPLPLPDGVSELAVGGERGDEPGVAWVFALAALAAVFALRSRRPVWG